MNEVKPFASLSSGLLARKGQAKPAMRPQAFGSMTVHDDLGWNDMGYPGNRPGASAAVSNPAPEPVAAEPVTIAPPVLSQQATIAREMQSEFEPAAAEASDAQRGEVVQLSTAKGLMPARGKVAFTLRLDPERHLRLRLASAVGNRSAQQIVTEAVDHYLQTMPDIGALAENLPARGKH